MSENTFSTEMDWDELLQHSDLFKVKKPPEDEMKLCDIQTQKRTFTLFVAGHGIAIWDPRVDSAYILHFGDMLKIALKYGFIPAFNGEKPKSNKLH